MRRDQNIVHVNEHCFVILSNEEFLSLAHEFLIVIIAKIRVQKLRSFIYEAGVTKAWERQ